MAAGIVLAFAAVLAMVVANSPMSDIYEHFASTHLDKNRLFSIDHHLLHWINDGLMVVFFFLVGTWAQAWEMLVGELSGRQKVVLPRDCCSRWYDGACDFYAAFNYQHADLMKGWAIPAATDIAFALGVLTLLGNRVPAALKVFWHRLLFWWYWRDYHYCVILPHRVCPWRHWLGGVCLVILWLMNRFNVTRTTAYIMIGVLLWAAMLKSGIHATFAGVLFALFIPMTDNKHPEHSPARIGWTWLAGHSQFYYFTDFAFANAGIYLGGTGISSLLHTVPLGIALGLLLGKPIGVMLFSWFGVKFGLASFAYQCWLATSIWCGDFMRYWLYHEFVYWWVCLCRALEVKPFDERLGIILGSLLAGMLGYFYLKKVLPTQALTQQVITLMTIPIFAKLFTQGHCNDK